MKAHAWRTPALSGLRIARACRRMGLCLTVLYLTMFAAVEAQDGEITEAAVKAAYLFQIGTYVDWPGPDSSDDPLTIAILGDGEVFDHLNRYLPGRTINGRPVAARPIASIDEFDADEILFIGDERALDELREAGVQLFAGSLIVTDVPEGIRIRPEAAINFRVVDSRVRFEINREAAARSGLNLSSRLLAAAYEVIGDG